MKALILCGGFARRLYPISDFVPKALLTLNGVPLVEYIISKLDGVKGMEKLYISTNLRFKNQFEYWLNLRKRAGLSSEFSLIVEPSTDESNKFGAVRGIAYDIEKGKINDDLLIIAGDNFFTFDLAEMVKKASKQRLPAIMVYDVKDKEKAKNFGVVAVSKDQTIKEFEEKPQKPKSTLISTGIYYLPKEYVGMVRKYIDETGKGDDIGEFIKWLANRAKVIAVKPKKGEWFDIGTLDGYRELFHKHNNIKHAPRA
jgi:glucose-1-phosphate thymidylyltransferase